MERDTGGNSTGEIDTESNRVITQRSERVEEFSVNFEKYEGKTEKMREWSISVFAGSAREIRNLIGELSAIIFFLRKSSSELSTSY
jgi:hypothetical protein